MPHGARDAEGQARVELRVADGSRAVTVWVSPEYHEVMVYPGDTLPEPLRLRGFAIEPMTCAPDAFNTGAGLVRLEPGERHQASWGIEPVDAAVRTPC